MMALTSGYNVAPANTPWITYVSGSTTTTSGTLVYPSPASAPAKKQTPLQWLEAEVERICAVTRPGLALS